MGCSRCCRYDRYVLGSDRFANTFAIANFVWVSLDAKFDGAVGFSHHIATDCHRQRRYNLQLPARHILPEPRVATDTRPWNSCKAGNLPALSIRAIFTGRQYSPSDLLQRLLGRILLRHTLGQSRVPFGILLPREKYVSNNLDFGILRCDCTQHLHRHSGCCGEGVRKGVLLQQGQPHRMPLSIVLPGRFFCAGGLPEGNVHGPSPASGM